jgi:hypothetical protein
MQCAHTRAPPPCHAISSCTVGNDARRARILRVPTQRLEHDERADAIVDRARDETVIRKVDALRVDHSRVADGESRFHFRAIRRADVDPEIRHLGRVLTIAVLHQVDRLLTDDTDDVTIATEKTNALADENLWIPTTNGRDVNETVVVDVLNDQPDLIEVAVEHDGR